jgi:outer membrane protein TolC
LRVEVQVSEAQSEALNASDNVETNNNSLSELLGQETTQAPQGTLPELSPDLANLVNTKGPFQRFDLEAQANRVEALNDLKKADAVHWLPRIGLVASYQVYNNHNDRFDDWSKFRNAYEAGVNLTWPLFDGFADVARSRASVEARIQAEKTLRMAELKAHHDVALWQRKVKYFHSVFKARQSDINKAQESVRLAREGRRAGSRTNTDLLDAETDLYRSQAGAINAQLGVIEALIHLELATGQKLYEFN